MSAIPDNNSLIKVKKEVEDQLEKIITKTGAREQKAQHTFVPVSTKKPLTEAVSDQTEKNPVEVTVIGIQGSTGAYEVVHGCNTIQIMEEVQNCPILTVPSLVSFQPIKEIVLPKGYKIKQRKEDFRYIEDLS